MNAIREIIEVSNSDLHIQLPLSYKGKKVEVLVVEIDDLRLPAPKGEKDHGQGPFLPPFTISTRNQSFDRETANAR